MSRRDLLIGLQHATEQGRKMREGTNLAESGPRGQVDKPGSVNPGIFGAKMPNTTYLPVREPNPTQTHVPGKGTNPMSTVGFGRAQKADDPNANIRTKMEFGDPAATAEQARRDENERKMQAAKMANEEYRIKTISDAISGLLESGARTRYITKQGKSEAFRRGVRGTGAVEERGHVLAAMTPEERNEMAGRILFGKLQGEAKRNPR